MRSSDPGADRSVQTLTLTLTWISQAAPVQFLFSWWVSNSPGRFAATLVAVFVIGFLQEAITLWAGQAQLVVEELEHHAFLAREGAETGALLHETEEDEEDVVEEDGCSQ